MKKPTKILLGVVATILFLFLLLNIFVKWKSADILRYIVKKFSKGQYTIEAETVQFHYRYAGIVATRARLKPVNKKLTPRPVELTADTLILNLSGYFSMLFYRNLNIHEIRITNPVLVLPPKKKKKHPEDFDIHDQLIDVQKVVTEMINSLRIGTFSIDNARIKIFTDTTGQHFFMADRIFLHMDHLFTNVAANQAKGQIKVKGNFHFWMDNPNIIYPDSNIKIGLDVLDWNSRKQRLTIHNISFAQSPTAVSDDSSNFNLGTVSIRHVDWDAWANSGQLFIDSIAANTGDLFIEHHHVNKRFRKPIEQRKLLKLLSPMDLRHFSVNKLKTTIVIYTKKGPLTGGLVGDSVGVEHFSIDVYRDVPLQLKGLSAVIEKFKGRDLEGRWETSFSVFRIKNDSAVLKNYVLQSTDNNPMGRGTSLNVPHMVLSGLSNTKLLEGKLVAQELSLTDPVIRIMLHGKNFRRNRSRFADKTLRERLPFLRVDHFLLQNGNLILTYPGRNQPFLTVSGIDGDVDLNKLFVSRSLNEQIAAANNMHARTAELNLSDASVQMQSITKSSPQNIVRIETTIAQLHHKAGKVELNDIVLQPYLRYKSSNAKNPLKLLNLSIGSGRVHIDEQHKWAVGEKAVKKKMSKIEQLYTIDRLQVGKVDIFYRSGRTKTVAQLQSATITGLDNTTGKIQWKKLAFNATGLRFYSRYDSLKADKVNFRNDGTSSFQNIIYNYLKEGEKIQFRAPSLQMHYPIQTLPGKNDVLAIQSVNIQRPFIEYSLLNDSTNIHFDGRLNHLVLSGVKMHKRADKKLSWNVQRIDMSTQTMRYTNDTLSYLTTAGITGSILNYHKAPKKPMSFAIDNLTLDSIHWRRGKEEKRYIVDIQQLKLGKTPVITIMKDSLPGLLYSYHLISLHGGNFMIDDPSQAIQFSNVNADLEAQTLDIDSFALRTKLPRDTLFARQKMEKDLFNIRTGKIQGNGLHTETVGSDSIVVVKKLAVDSLHLIVERDKRVKDDTVTYRPLLARMLQRIPTSFNADTIVLSNGLVWHNLIEPKNGREGSIYFGDINGTIENMRNARIHDDDTLSMHLNANLLGKGHLTMRFKQSYKDSLQTFLLYAQLGKYQPSDLNSILDPLINVRVTQGQIDSLWLKAQANDYFAFGNMKVNYHGLKVEVLNDKRKRRGFISWIANIIIRTNNKKKGYVYVERMRNKAIFNYWAKIALSGLLNNAGIKSNKKYIKEYKKAIKKYNLPEEKGF